MNKNIISVKDLYIGGKMIAFIKGNRSVNSKNISRKKKSFEKFGMNLVPLMYVDGQKAVNDGCTLVHPITKEDIPDEEASKYVAIVEGQHRYTAAEETGLDEEKLFLYECYSNENTKEILSETNTITDPWSGADYANGAALFNPQNELAKFTKNAGTTERDGRNDAKRLCTNVVTVSDEVKPKKRKMQGKAEYSRRTVCKSLPKKM